MPRGEVQLFEEFSLQLGSAGHDLSSGGNTIKVALVDDSLVPTAGQATPTYTDFSAGEMANGNGYTTGGETINNQTYTEAAGVATYDGDDVSWTEDASGFEDAYYAIVYDDTNPTKSAIGFVDLDGPVSLRLDDVGIAWNPDGILRVTVTVQG